MLHKRKEHSLFNKSTKMCEVIHANYHLLSVINSLGIKLGFGDKTIQSICIQDGLDIDFFLMVINAYTFPEYFSNNTIPAIEPKTLIEYLQNTHKYYLKAILPALNELINQLTVSHAQSTKSTLIQRFYKDCVKDFTNHIEFEEQVVYPYIVELANFEKSNKSKEDFTEISSKILDFNKKHVDIVSKLFDLKNILLKYFSAPDDDLVIHILFLLFRFEKDLLEHSRLEDFVLIPKIAELEQKIF